MRGSRRFIGLVILALASIVAAGGCPFALPVAPPSESPPEEPQPPVDVPPTDPPTDPPIPPTEPQPARTASIRGTLTVPTTRAETILFEQEPNSSVDQPQFVGAVVAGEVYSVFGTISAFNDELDAFEFITDAPVQVTFSLSFRNDNPVLPTDFEVGVFDGVTANCALGAATAPMFTQCFDSADNPEAGSFDAEGAFVIAVVPFSGADEYQLQLSFSAPTAPAALPLVTGSPAPRAPVLTAEADDGVVPDEVLVEFEAGATAATRTAALTACGLSLIEASPSGWCRARRVVGKAMTASRQRALTRSAAEQLAEQPGVRQASSHRKHTIARTPNDAYYNLQWHYPLIHLPEAWDLVTGSDDVVMAVVDTGILHGHPDIQGRLINGYDFIDDPETARDGDGRDADPEDPGDLFGGPGQSSFHGTHVTGTLGALTDNGNGVAGATWATRVMPLRALGVGGGSDFDIAEAIRYAAGLPNISGLIPAQPARVINLSISGGAGEAPSEAIRAAVEAAAAADIVVVAAAGNQASTLPAYPAAFDDVIAVGAVDLLQRITNYSNFGSWLTVVAPGGDIGADLNGDGWTDGVLSPGASDAGGTIVFQYRFENGTSMATPHVSGLAALLFAANPALSAVEVREIIETTARDLGTPGRDDVFGFGLIDASAAVEEAMRRAGIAPSNTPRLKLGTSSLDFGHRLEELRVTVSNTGGGTINVTGIRAETFDSGPWLSATAGGPGPGTNVSEILVAVVRDGLPPGGYRGRVIIETDSLSDQTLDVRMLVGTDAAATEVLFVLAVDPEAFFTIGQDVADASGGFAYGIGELLPGRYVLYAGTDRDGDGIICEPGDLCGALPSVIEPTVVELAEGEVRTGTDFAVALQVLQPAGNVPTSPVTLQRLE
ncbi:MAG: S8 family serine peptidase [Phycisphaerae bacterium]|nr:S8 family serine peptidase [Phycisphaerae bacterium]